MRYTKALSTESSRKAPPKSERQVPKDDKNEHVSKEEENAYIVLNLPKDASWEDISSAYKKMARMYHPDKVTGLAPEYREIAEKQMRLINAAYELLYEKTMRKLK